MTALALQLALTVVLALPVLALAAAMWPGRRTWLPAGTALCGAALLLAGLTGLLAGGPAAGLALPLGGLGLRAQVVLDPLSAFFLLPLGLSMGAAGLWAVAAQPLASSPFLPLLPAGMVLAVLAANVWTLIFGLGLMSAAAWAVIAGQRDAAAAARLTLGVWLAAGLALLVGLLLLAPATGSASYAAIRAAPTDGWRTLTGLVLVLLGAGAGAGMAPFHPWLPPAHAAAPAETAALLSAGMPVVALYALVRVFFDLAGPALPIFWSLPLLLMGVVGALLGMLRANLEPDIMSVLADDTIGHVGLIGLALGLGLAARALDLDGLAALALAAALLHLLAHAMFKTLLFLGAGSAATAAGSRALADLGGLARRMPWITLCMLVAAASAAGLPPAFGFTSLWLILQALFSAARSGGIILPSAMAVSILLTGVATALAGAAMVRLMGIGFLGRPRSAGAATAANPGLAAPLTLAGLAALLLVLGLLPEAALALARPVIASLPGLSAMWQSGLGGVATHAGGAAWLPLGVTALLAAGIAGGLRAFWRQGHTDGRRAPAWAGGLASPPWLAEGDPTTQISAASLAQPVLHNLGGMLLGTREHIAPIPSHQPASAVHAANWSDPAERFLFAPVGVARVTLSAWVDRLHSLTLRHRLGVVLVTLLLLAIIALRGKL